MTASGPLIADNQPLEIEDTGVIESYLVSTAATAEAGATFAVSVTALDVFGNTVDGASSPINLEAVNVGDNNPTGTPLGNPTSNLNAGLASAPGAIPKPLPE